MPPPTVLFASSFDNGTPFAPWSSHSSVTIVTGRNVNGANIPTGAHLGGTGTFGTSAAFGVGCQFSNFGGALALQDASNGSFGGFMQVGHYGDGRISITAGSNALGISTTNFDNIGLVINLNEWYYYELVGTLSQTQPVLQALGLVNLAA